MPENLPSRSMQLREKYHNDAGRTELLTACLSGTHAEVRRLLASAPESAQVPGLSTDFVTRGGLPLHVACDVCEPEMAMALLAAFPDGAKKTDSHGSLALHVLAGALQRAPERIAHCRGLISRLLELNPEAVNSRNLLGAAPQDLAPTEAQELVKPTQDIGPPLDLTPSGRLPRPASQSVGRVAALKAIAGAPATDGVPEVVPEKKEKSRKEKREIPLPGAVSPTVKTQTPEPMRGTKTEKHRKSENHDTMSVSSDTVLLDIGEHRSHVATPAQNLTMIAELRPQPKPFTSLMDAIEGKCRCW